jgi:phosphate transport system permease protein
MSDLINTAGKGIDVPTQMQLQHVRRGHLYDRIARTVFLCCAILLVIVIVGIFFFVGQNALHLFFEPGGATFQGFFGGTTWDPTGVTSDSGIPQYGALGLIIGSIVITFFSVLIATPLAIGVALFFVEVSPGWTITIRFFQPLLEIFVDAHQHALALDIDIIRFFQPLLEIFVGVPSVVIGFLGLVVLVPFMTKLVAPITGNSPVGGYGWAAAIIVLVVMIVPTIASISIDALRAVPMSVREASLALGSTRWQMMYRAVLPAALPALATAVVFGMARAIGETLAVAMVLGGSDILPSRFGLDTFFQPNTNITQAILNEFPETYGVSRDAYWMLAFVLLVISFLFICISRYFASRRVYR